MIVVADTSPINYLVLIQEIEVLASLYDSVLITPEVHAELTRDKTPAEVRRWASQLPSWIVVVAARKALPALSPELDLGEASAIALAFERKAQVAIDERLGRSAAAALGLSVIGTIGILRDAAQAGLLDLRTALVKLEASSFWISPAVIRALLERS